jgi:hypothetical protein
MIAGRHPGLRWRLAQLLASMISAFLAALAVVVAAPTWLIVIAVVVPTWVLLAAFLVVIRPSLVQPD